MGVKNLGLENVFDIMNMLKIKNQESVLLSVMSLASDIRSASEVEESDGDR